MISAKTKKRLKKIFLNPYFWIIILVLLYMSPSLLSPHFSYIDDGQSILNAKTIVESSNPDTWKNKFFESNIGRLRPAYQLYFVILYLIGGVNPLVFWIGQTLTILGTMVGIWKFFENSKNVNKKILAFFMAMFLIVPSNIDNFYRLGTAEPRQALGIIWLLVWLKKLNFKKITLKNILYGNILLLFTLATKETSLLMIPLMSLFFFSKWLTNKKNRKSIIFVAATIIFQGLLFYSLMPKFQGYASSMSFSLAHLWNSLLITRLEFAEYYLPLIMAVLGTLANFIFNTPEKKNIKLLVEKFIWPIIFLAGVVISITFIFSWEYQLERYHYLPFFFAILYMIQEFSNWKWNRKNLLFIFLPTAALFIYFFQMRGLSYLKFMNRSYEHWYFQYKTYQSAGKLIDFLYYKLPENTTVFIDHDDYEKIVDLGYFATRFGERKVNIYSNNQGVHNKFPSTQFYADSLRKLHKQTEGYKVFIYFDSSPDRYFKILEKNF